MANEIQEDTLINNILSLVRELKQLNTAETTDEGAAVEEALEQTGTELDMKKPVIMAKAEVDDEDEDDVKKIVKTIISTPSDSTTASDDAEERIEGVLPEVDEKNIDEVAKAIAKLLTRKSVKKSVKVTSSNEGKILEAVNIVAKNQKILSDKYLTIEKALTDVLSAVGVADEITKIEKAEVVTRVEKGLNSGSDIDRLIDALKLKSVEKSEDVGIDNISTVRKTLSDSSFLSTLYGKK